MKVMLLTDLEGIAGVTDAGFMDRKGETYALAQRLLCESINLAVQTCFDSGAEHVWYVDGHAGGGNVIESLLDPRAEKCSMAQWQQLLRDGEIDCQLELGSHARAGTLGGFLDHTISSQSWFCHRVNGREMSELSMHALLCGAYGVPIAACIGDEAACVQAKEYIPEIITGAVKKALCRNEAVSYDDADEILVNAVRTALAQYPAIPPFRMQEPLTVELTFCRTDMCEEALQHYGSEVVRVDARTLQRRVGRLTRYEELKF